MMNLSSWLHSNGCVTGRPTPGSAHRIARFAPSSGAAPFLRMTGFHLSATLQTIVLLRFLSR